MKTTKKFTRQDGFSESGLLHVAVDHLGSAKVLFVRGPRCFDSAGYLCHLGIELVLKAMLLNKCDEFPNQHSLTKLTELIEKQSINVNYGKNHSDTVAMLDGFNELRYPNPSSPVEIGDEDWDRVESLFDFLILLLPEEIQEELKQMDNSNKDNRVLIRRKKTI